LSRRRKVFRLQGVSLSEKAKNTESGGTLGAWFLSQSRLALENSRIIWRNEKNGREVTFDGVSVELQNMSARHRLNASMQLPAQMGKELRLALDIHGNLLNQKDWVGELYLKARQVKPAQWIEKFDYQGVRFTRGNVDLELWSSWQGGLLEGGEGVFDVSDLVVSRNKRKLPISQLSGQWRYRNNEHGWQLMVQNATLRDGNEITSPFHLQLQDLDGVSSIRAENLDIDRLMAFTPYLPGVSAAQRKQLHELAPAGWVDTLRVDLKEGELIGVTASLKEFSCEPSQQIPGMNGLNAQLGFDGNNALLDVDTESLTLDMPTLFENSLSLQKTRGIVHASREGKGWRLVTNGLQVDNSDVHLQLGMSLQIAPNESPLIAMVGHFSDGLARAAPAYLPAKIMSPGSVHWLKRAFSGGIVEDGSLLVHGVLDHSLMREQQGRFEVRFNAKDVALDYQEGWPRLAGVRGEAVFSGKGMEVRTTAARLYTSPVGATTVRIRDFAHPLLELDGVVHSTATDALRFLREAPFTEGIDLRGFTAKGNAPVRLKMAIPLSAAVAKESPLSIDGEVKLQRNHLHFAKGVDLAGTSGVLKFTEKRFTADEIKATMYGFPATLAVYTEPGDGDQRGKTVVAVRGHARAKSVHDELELPILERASGESDWQASLQLNPGEEGGVLLDIYSDLEGVAVDLPAPMTKEAEVSRPFSITLGLGGSYRGRHSLQYGQLLSATWQQDDFGGELLRLAVRLGEGDVPELPGQRLIRVSGSLDDFNWLPWRKLSARYLPGDNAADGLPLQIHMRRLHLVKQEGEAESSDALTRMPTIDLSVVDFAYDDLVIGGISGRILPASSGLVRFNNILIAAPNFKVESSGSWYPGGKSRFNLNLTSGNLGKMFRDLGFASVIEGGKTRAKGEVEWPGSPLAFSLETIQANGRVNIEEGVIEQIDPGAGKLLGLLSLEALPRRLFLDFSDLSQKGLRFSSIKGDIRIQNGDAVTDKIVLKSLPAEVLITGRTGLIKHDFEQTVTVVPHVSDTVSVAGALAWGPEVAAVLALLQSLFKVDEASMTRYEITGTWEEPVITRQEPAPVAANKNGE